MMVGVWQAFTFESAVSLQLLAEHPRNITGAWSDNSHAQGDNSHAWGDNSHARGHSAHA